MKNFALIGHHLGHTLSPFIHRELFLNSGVKAGYEVLDFPAEELKSHLPRLFGTSGFNITIPHKRAIMPFLKRLDAGAEACGAVNTVLCAEEATGYNTDGYGLAKALEGAGISLGGRTVICGAGGAARAAAFLCKEHGCEIVLFVRRENEAVRLLYNDLSKAAGRVSIISSGNIPECNLLINATPTGMYPNVGSSPVTSTDLEGCGAVFDMVYNPKKTVLLEMAERLDKKCSGGMPMLVWQAARAHEIWYGAEFDKRDVQEIIGKAEAFHA